MTVPTMLYAKKMLRGPARTRASPDPTNRPVPITPARHCHQQEPSLKEKKDRARRKIEEERGREQEHTSDGDKLDMACLQPSLQVVGFRYRPHVLRGRALEVDIRLFLQVCNRHLCYSVCSVQQQQNSCRQAGRQEFRVVCVWWVNQESSSRLACGEYV